MKSHSWTKAIIVFSLAFALLTQPWVVALVSDLVAIIDSNSDQTDQSPVDQIFTALSLISTGALCVAMIATVKLLYLKKENKIVNL